MKKQALRRLLSWLLVLCLVLPLVPAADAASVSWTKTDLQLKPQRTDRLVQQTAQEDRDPREPVRVSIVLEEPSTVQAGYATMGIASNTGAMAYRQALRRSQERMEKTISNQVLGGKPLDVVWNMTLVGNIISAWVPYGTIGSIEALPGVRTVAMEAQYQPCVAQRGEEIAPNAYASSAMTGSGYLWSSGYTGAGSRIAVVDTGIDTAHQSLDNGAFLHALGENAAARGMTLNDYRASLELLTLQEISRVLPELNLHDMDPTVTAQQLYGTEKLVFGYNYVDRSLNIDHMDDQQGEHGSHVAGIAAANRYIPQDGGYVDAKSSVMMQGVAPDAQLLTMKVFGQQAPFDSDYMAAIEDAILLGCDVVNLSLGTTAPGAPRTEVYQDLMQMMTETDTVVVISAGNAGNWAAATGYGYLYHDDVSFDTVGAPGSYASAFTVASVDNSGNVGAYFAANGCSAFYTETLGYGNAPFAQLDWSENGTGTEYDYVFLDGLGYDREYEGISVAGKIVLVSRGVLNFSEKANNAFRRGAAAVVIYNNEPGISNMDLTGLGYYAPVVSISQAEGEAIRASSQDHGTYRSGKLTAYARMGVGQTGGSYYQMSGFSSWGVPGDLTLKPEITAPGGNIYSLWGSNAFTGGGTDRYEYMSGTSMAAPQVAGMAALLAQLCREQGLAQRSGISPRHLAQSLLMSTAQPLYEENSGGNYYSLLSQGAGLARVDLAAQAESFIKVQGQEDYKVKAELGDDPARTGTYAFSFTITNLTDQPAVYTLDADLFRQDVFEYQPGSDVWLLDNWTVPLDGDVTFTSSAVSGGLGANCDLNGDGFTNAGDADHLLEFLLGNAEELYANGDLSGDGMLNSYDAHLLLSSLGGDVVTLPAGGSAQVHVQLKLTPEAKKRLDAETPNGTYVQAFVYARSQGTTHSIPVLAFYGDWSEPSMFDRGTLMELTYGTTSQQPYLERFVGPYGNSLVIDYGDGIEYYFGGNPFTDEDTYLPERNAFNSADASRITEQSFTLIRGAGDARIRVANADTGEVYLERNLGQILPAYYNPGSGAWENAIQSARVGWSGLDAAGMPLAEGTKVAVSMTAVPYYYRQEDGSYPFEGLGDGSTMTTTFTIDNTAPQILDMDVSRIEEDKLIIQAKDNRHVAAVALLNSSGTKVLAIAPANQTEANSAVSVELDLTEVYGKNFQVAILDYASNMTAYETEIDLGGRERDYFTAIDSYKRNFMGINQYGVASIIAETGIPVSIRAAEYVSGYVLFIAEDNSLWIAEDEELTPAQRVCQLDPGNELQITGVNDMAYDYADGKLYVLFHSGLNVEMTPYLATLDLHDGSLELVCQLPVDVNTMAIDGKGNFYSVGTDSNVLYTYTLDQVTGSAPAMSRVGGMGEYISSQLSSMAWDHNRDALYWASPNALLRIDPQTAKPTALGYYFEKLVGLYIRPEDSGQMPAPVDTVDRVELSQESTRVLLGNTAALQANVWPLNASDRRVSWTTSDPSVATVDQLGRVTGVGLGECVITATSKLDPGKTASCRVSTFELDKTLRALMWDAAGNAWMGEFNTNTIPDCTKLQEKPFGEYLASASVDHRGNLYAASYSISYGRPRYSELYSLDAATYQTTLVGSSSYGYVDMAPAPSAPYPSVMAVGNGALMYIGLESGGFYHMHLNFTNPMAIAYVGTQDYREWGFDSKMDWYFIIDCNGYVHLRGFMVQDGVYYQMEHPQLAPGGIYTKLDFATETPYFSSAWFDGQMLYFIAYQQERGATILRAIDVAGGSKACYELGAFDGELLPVGGLMEPGEVENHIGIILDGGTAQTMSRPIPVEQQPEPMDSPQSRAGGGVNSTAVPMSTPEVKEDLVFVDITLPEPGTNARMTVFYDEAMLELTDVSGNAAAFAWREMGDTVHLALAESGMISTEQTVARLTFRPLASGETTVTVTTQELGQQRAEWTEELNLSLTVEQPHVHSHVPVITAPTCTEQGYTTYTCHCGDSYVADYTEPLGHAYENGICIRCGAANNPFTDVPQGQFYFEPVLWAVEQGITTGTSATTFNPGGVCMRGHVVTFLWRAMGSPEPTTTVNPFVDVKESDYFYKAVLWAFENGITTGVDATHFAPTGECNRAQVVTFLWRAMEKPDSQATVDFTDVQPCQFYTVPVAWAVENGITNGMGDGTFGVLKTCNRAQVVTFLYRTLT